MFYLVDLFWKPSTLLHNDKLCQSLGRGNSVLKFWLNLGKSIVGIYFFFYCAPQLVWSLGSNLLAQLHLSNHCMQHSINFHVLVPSVNKLIMHHTTPFNLSYTAPSTLKALKDQ